MRLALAALMLAAAAFAVASAQGQEGTLLQATASIPESADANYAENEIKFTFPGDGGPVEGSVALDVQEKKLGNSDCRVPFRIQVHGVLDGELSARDIVGQFRGTLELGDKRNIGTDCTGPRRERLTARWQAEYDSASKQVEGVLKLLEGADFNLKTRFRATVTEVPTGGEESRDEGVVVQELSGRNFGRLIVDTDRLCVQREVDCSESVAQMQALRNSFARLETLGVSQNALGRRALRLMEHVTYLAHARTNDGRPLLRATSALYKVIMRLTISAAAADDPQKLVAATRLAAICMAIDAEGRE